MPAKGTRKLSDRQKVEIVVQKQVVPRKRTDTYSQLAQKMDVSETTIRKTTYESLTERQKELYDETVRNLKFSSLSLTAKAIEKSEELVGQAEATRDLAGVVAAGKFGHDVYRLETNQSTQNIAHRIGPADILSNYVERALRAKLQDGSFPTMLQVLAALQAERKLEGVTDEQREAWIEGEVERLGLIGKTGVCE